MRKNNNQVTMAKRKCSTEYRKILSLLNRHLNTTQIYQCENNWKSINFDKNVTSITMRKQSYAFQNRDKNNNIRKHYFEKKSKDREECANNYKEYINDCSSNKKTSKREKYIND